MAAGTTSHGRLVELHTHLSGRRVFARFVFTTGDTMGMNMVNIAAERICRHATEMMRCERYYLRCNYSSDKWEPCACWPVTRIGPAMPRAPHRPVGPII